MRERGRGRGRGRGRKKGMERSSSRSVPWERSWPPWSAVTTRSYSSAAAYDTRRMHSQAPFRVSRYSGLIQPWSCPAQSVRPR